MDLAVFTPAELPVALSALAGIARANGSITDAERVLLDFIRSLHGGPPELPPLVDISPADVAEVIRGAHARKRLVQLAMVTALCDGEVTKAQDEAVRALAAALGIDDGGLRVVHDLAGRHLLLARFDTMRRMLPTILGDIWEQDGLRGLVRVAQSLRRTNGDEPDIAWRYKQLGLLPAGTVGRVFWEHCTQRRFAFPGERGGIPERLVYHDFAHVLSGYDTDPAGEIAQGAFQAGNRRDDGFVFLLFVLLQFHMGVRAQPVVDPQKGLFEPQRVLGAVARGAACKVDLTDGWDFWPIVERPLDEVRAEYGIPQA